MIQPQTVESTPDQVEQSRQTEAVPPAPGRSRRRIVALVILVALAAATFLVWKLFFAAPRVPDSILNLSGRIEGDDSAVAPKTAGRILEVRFREGDSVNAGDTIAILEDQQVRAREEQAQAAVLQAQARAKSARRLKAPS